LSPEEKGSCNSRLEIINNLPEGKVIWHFDRTDIKIENLQAMLQAAKEYGVYSK
jgi:5,10-methylenetetrahydrofolate reductase